MNQSINFKNQTQYNRGLLILNSLDISEIAFAIDSFFLLKNLSISFILFARSLLNS